MSEFDFSTLITDRTAADVVAVSELVSKIKAGTATDAEIAAFNTAAMKGAYNYTDLNRVTAAMEYLDETLRKYGYVTGYQRLEIPHSVEVSVDTSDPPIPTDFQFLDVVTVNGETVDTAVGYANVADAVDMAVRLPVPENGDVSLGYSTKSAISNGSPTGVNAYSNFDVYESKASAMSFEESAVANGGAVRNFSGIKSGYYWMIATENYGAVQYYAYLFQDMIEKDPFWYELDKPSVSLMVQYLSNVLTIYNTILSDPELPETMENLDYNGANQIEQALVAVQNAIQRMESTWFYSGEIFCGEV